MEIKSLVVISSSVFLKLYFSFFFLYSLVTKEYYLKKLFVLNFDKNLSVHCRKKRQDFSPKSCGINVTTAPGEDSPRVGRVALPRHMWRPLILGKIPSFWGAGGSSLLR